MRTFTPPPLRHQGSPFCRIPLPSTDPKRATTAARVSVERVLAPNAPELSGWRLTSTGRLHLHPSIAGPVHWTNGNQHATAPPQPSVRIEVQYRIPGTASLVPGPTVDVTPQRPSLYVQVKDILLAVHEAKLDIDLDAPNIAASALGTDHVDDIVYHGDSEWKWCWGGLTAVDGADGGAWRLTMIANREMEPTA